MTSVLEIEDLWFEDGGSRIVVDAVVDGMVVVIPQSNLYPAEWGPALCRGSFYLHEEDLIPASDDGLRKLLSERIDDWAPLDTSDWDD
jgi:hypothetical protein